MSRQYELVERVKSYDPDANEVALNRAYLFSMARHGAQKRASGDLYFSHPLEVAGILTDLKLDSASVVTGLLHDTVEDGVATEAELQAHFGAEIARLVDGVTKLSKLELQSDPTRRQAENFRKLLLAMSEDIRVLLVKLADRLHNMRTLQHIESADKRRRIAGETMEIYVPLAERIGMQEMKAQLEDLAFAELNREARDSINRRLVFLRETEGAVISVIIDELTRTLADSGLVAEVHGREKRPYSIWRKMEQKEVAFERIADVVAFRIIVDSIDACYQALGIVHRAYPMVPGKFKDYVSTPKPNGYRSIHTTVIGPERRRIEIQIRTREMHEVAEFGVAAHWVYKQGVGDVASREGRRYRWLRELLEIVEHAGGPEEFLEHTKLEMYQDQVFCFTPKGDLLALPRDATPVDFAYAVHSDVGDRCVGAKINGRVAPLRSRLRNGDQVEILGSSAQTPDPNWEKFVVSGKARTRIRRFIRQQENAEFASLGHAILEKTFQNDGHELTGIALAPALTKYKMRNVNGLYGAVGQGNLDPRDVLATVFPEAATPRAEDNVVRLKSRRGREPNGAIPIRGLTPGMAVHMADCCHPLPGDRIVGLVTEGKGVTVHTIDCEVLESFAGTPERWLDVAWTTSNQQPDIFTGRIATVLNNVPGSLNAMTEVIARTGGNISNLKITHRSPDFFEFVVDVEVRDVKHLTNIIAALRADPAIYQVERAGR
ncbi:MAG: bifunctional (p)ppGpp synthetase/guanosine-3',5'-bis(diphosphate) 3'-pyrophosphohydrolase [Alphaproteobacteria bacterium]|jgi:GTP pyrophosphokinase|nr:bifunctional (p)ppGpp synthetase/guanosine-3',5'-bis(diphosphate) 3'-pyrophosphohydrolase [Alphaproteobacteria bacterium]